ncbi:MAG: DUF4363 family protein [Clostridiales bacterium]|nr:DUF4363 family protein [Clostridiales bacterium]
MIKTIVSLLITIGLIFGVSYYENTRVRNTFSRFNEVLETLYDKTEAGEVTYEDGTAVEKFWENQKNTLHIWLPHTAIQEIDYQLYEAVGYLYVRDFDSAMPKIEILIGMCQNIPQSYRFSWENIL